MTRSLSLLALFATAAMATAAPALAQAGAMRANLASPLERAQELMIDGVVWSCAGQACVSRSADPRPAVACRKLARKVGSVERFVSPRAELDAAGLTACNQDRQ